MQCFQSSMLMTREHWNLNAFYTVEVFFLNSQCSEEFYVVDAFVYLKKSVVKSETLVLSRTLFADFFFFFFFFALFRPVKIAHLLQEIFTLQIDLK